MTATDPLAVEYRREQMRLRKIAELYGWLSEAMGHHQCGERICQEHELMKELHELLFGARIDDYFDLHVDAEEDGHNL